MVFGAAFDPPHLGHQLMVEAVLKLGLADGVWLLPAKRHPFAKSLSADHHRLQMLELMVAELDDPRVIIQKHELKQNRVSYTYQTLTELKKSNPEVVFSFLIGSDNLTQFHLWDQYQQMLEEFTFYVYPRSGYAMKPLYHGMIPLKDVEQVNTSSTHIRSLVKDKQPIDHLVLPNIAEYIAKNKLYLPE